MNGEGCWSTVVCRPDERAALGLTGESAWLLQCRLAIGHRGNHATDASAHPRHDRRLWLEWNDFDDRAQSLIERNPCPVPSPEGAGCVFFAGHGGPHFFARSNGHAPAVMTGAGPVRYARPVAEPGPAPGQAPHHGGPTTGPVPSAPSVQSPRPVEPPPPTRAPLRMGSHRLPDTHIPAPVEPGQADRGGRRATGAEPPSAEDYQGRRRRPEPVVEPGVQAGVQSGGQPDAARPDTAGTGAATTDTEVRKPPVTRTPEPPVPEAPMADPAPSATSDAARHAAISAALDEVAIALAHLAAALRS